MYLLLLKTRPGCIAEQQRSCDQALNAIVFLYKNVLKKELGSIDAVRARKPKRLPVVLTVEETLLVLSQLSGVKQLMARLLYGSGLRLMECHRLRVKDIDITAKQIMVCNGKGFKDRVTVLAETVIPLLNERLIRVKALHKDFLGRGYGEVELPFALERKYPNAKYEWGWQYVFPAKNISTDPRSKVRRRHHIHESSFPISKTLYNLTITCNLSDLFKYTHKIVIKQTEKPGESIYLIIFYVFAV